MDQFGRLLVEKLQKHGDLEKFEFVNIENKGTLEEKWVYDLVYNGESLEVMIETIPHSVKDYKEYHACIYRSKGYQKLYFMEEKELNHLVFTGQYQNWTEYKKAHNLA